MTVTAAELLSPPILEPQIPLGVPSLFVMARHRPLFSAMFIREMLADPRILYGLWLIKGPILAQAKVKVVCQQEEVRNFLIDQINRFWQTGLIPMLSAIEWGFSGCEVLYEELNGQVHYNRAILIDGTRIRAVTERGCITGINVYNASGKAGGKTPIYIGKPRVLYHVHWREKNPFYGVSRLLGAFIPWWEIWSEGGYRDIRRLWYYRNAFEGGVMYHPQGVLRMPSGEIVEAKELARELMTKKRSGGGICLPNTPAGDNGSRAWEYHPPSSNPAPEGMLDYGEILRTELLEGMGIPPEIVQSGGNQGFGSSSGRQIPQEAFYAILQELFQHVVHDINECILKHLVEINFGPGVSYNLEPQPLANTSVTNGPQNGNNGNQFVNEEGKPFNKEQVKELTGEKPKGAPFNRSEFLKSKSPFKMAHEVEDKSPPRADSGRGTWITIGGRAEGGKQHVGGFPVKVDASGRILAGGPKSLHGTHVTDAGKNLKKLDNTYPEKKYEQSEDRERFGLPHNDSKLSEILRQAVGDDPQEQAGFYEIMKEVHAELLETAKKRREVSSQAKEQLEDTKGKNWRGITPEKVDSMVDARQWPKFARANNDAIKETIKKGVEEGRLKTQQDVKRLLDSTNKWLEKSKGTKTDVNLELSRIMGRKARKDYTEDRFESLRGLTAKSWPDMVKKLSAEWGLSAEEIENSAEELMEAEYGHARHYNDVLWGIRSGKTASQQMSGGKIVKVSSGELNEIGKQTQGIRQNRKGYEDAGGLVNQKLGLDVLADHLRRSFPEFGIHDDEAALEAIRKGPLYVPNKTSRKFVSKLSKFLGVSESDLEDKPITHPDVVRLALQKISDMEKEGDPWSQEEWT